MRTYVRVVAITAVFVALGCTTRQLRVSTVRQARTLTDIQYEQVLNNLAMFCINPDSLPSLVSLKSGSTQIGDTGQLGFLGVAGLNTLFGSSPTINASRSVVDQWGTAPVTDDNVLRVLRMAYRTATGHPSLLNEKDANDIGHDLSQQIGTNADISTDLELLKALASLSANSSRDGGVSPANDAPETLPMPTEQPLSQKNGPPPRPKGRKEPSGSGTALENAPPPLPMPPKASPSQKDGVPARPIKRNEPPESRTALELAAEKQAREVSQKLRAFDAALRNTLDDEFLMYKNAQNPCEGFIIKSKDPKIEKWQGRPLEPADKAKIKELTEQLQRIRPDFDIYQLVGTTGLTKETARRINDIQDELCKIATMPPGWFGVGGQKDVPKNACYVGHANCGCQERCVWVCSDGLGSLADFTLSILKLSSTFQETQLLTVPTGIQYSPAFSRTGR